MIPLLQTKTADKAHMEIFVSVTRPFCQFWAQPGDEATCQVSNSTCQVSKLKLVLEETM